MTTKTNTHSIKRSDIQPLFAKRLDRLGFDTYGYFNQESFKETALYKKHPHTLELLENSKREVAYQQHNVVDTNIEWHINDHTYNKVIIRPFYWGDLPMIAEKDNFSYPSMNVTIDWYKYALRAAASSHQLTDNLINQIFNNVENTLINTKGE